MYIGKARGSHSPQRSWWRQCLSSSQISRYVWGPQHSHHSVYSLYITNKLMLFMCSESYKVLHDFIYNLWRILQPTGCLYGSVVKHCLFVFSLKTVPFGNWHTPYNWLNKFYSFYLLAVISIINGRGFRIEARCRNQPNESKVSLCMPL